MCSCVPVHVCACVYWWCQEKKEKHSAGENRQVVGDGEIGTGPRSDSERERIKGTVTSRSKDRASEGGDWARKGRAPETQ